MAETREEIEKWAALSDEDWVAMQVPRFVEIRPRYLLYAEFLQSVLKQGCARLAPLALIEARAKSVPSFAEKILRKRKLYMRPKGDIARRSAGPHDGPLRRAGHRPDFGPGAGHVPVYRGDVQHRPRQQRGRQPAIASHRVRLPLGALHRHDRSEETPGCGGRDRRSAEVLGLKAEIQVRTLLEHAWADIGHEMTYKTELRVPDRIHRQFASLAAVLEGVDRQFGMLVHGLEEFKSNFGAYHERKEVDAEIARLRIVLSYASRQRGRGGKDCPACAFRGPTRGRPGNLAALRRRSEPRRRARPRPCPGRNALGPSAQPGVSRRPPVSGGGLLSSAKRRGNACAHWRKAGSATTRQRPAGLFHQAVAVDATAPAALRATSNSKSPMCPTIPSLAWRRR